MGESNMAVLQSSFWRVTPGANAEFMQAAGEAKKIHQRMGAEVAMVSWSSAGSLSGTIAYGLNHADLGAWARFSDSGLQDAEWQAWIAKFMGSATPMATLLSQTTASDQPGFDSPGVPAPGSFMLVVQAQLAAGHTTADALSLLGDVTSLATEHGADSTRVLRVGSGGESTLRFSSLFGFANAQAYADWQVKYVTDPRGAALNERAFGPGSPFTGQAMLQGRVLAI
jgi:hypothetical protein